MGMGIFGGRRPRRAEICGWRFGCEITDTTCMSREVPAPTIDEIQRELESLTGTRWRLRRLNPDGYLVATSENDGDSIKLIASNLREAATLWPNQLRQFRYGRLAG